MARDLPAPRSERVVEDLRSLAARTSNERGAQRVAWGPVWREARAWFTEVITRDLALPVRLDAAANAWVTLPGASADALIIGSHLDSVPSGGWLDGCLGVIAGIEVLRRQQAAGEPPVTIHLVDWADEEGARFGRSLAGSAASAGTLDPERELAHLVDRDGVRLPDALRANDVDYARLTDAAGWFRGLNARAYLELHIEQGPVLEALGRPAGVVLGTMGVERHQYRFVGQAAHAGATPIPLRQDAFLAAAEFALACRDIGLRHSQPGPEGTVVATCGVVQVRPGFVTAIPGNTDISLDLRALDATILARMHAEAQQAAQTAARNNRVQVTSQPILQIPPRPFHPALMSMCSQALTEICGHAPRLPSGPLHDASEMAAMLPTAMLFAQSSPGISHCREEDTPPDALDASIRSFLTLADRVVARGFADLH